MKSSLYLLLLFFSYASAQNTLEGTVYLYKNKGANLPFENVYIKAEGSQPDNSKENGYYKLIFDNNYKIIKIKVFKQGYEFINRDKADSVDLFKVKLFDIYLDIEGNTQKRENYLIAKITDSLKNRYNSQIKILQKKDDKAHQLLKTLEKIYQTHFSDFYEASSFLAEQKEKDKSEIEELIKFAVRENLDHSNSRYNRIIGFVEKGYMDSINTVFHPSDFIAAVNARKQAQQNDISSGYLYISGYALPKGLYDSVDYTYRGIIDADPANKKNLLKAGLFYYNNNRIASLKNLLSHYNLNDFKSDTTFFTLLSLLKSGLAIKSDDFISMAFILAQFVSYYADKPLAVNLTNYDVSVSVKLGLIGLLFDVIDYNSRYMAEIDATANIDKLVNDSSLSKPDEMYDLLPTLDSSDFDINLASSLLCLAIGNMFYDKQHYLIASKYYKLALTINQGLPKLSISLKKQENIDYEEFDSLFLKKYGMQTCLRLISCGANFSEIQISDSLINATQKTLKQCVKHNPEAFLKEEYEFYKNAGIIKIKKGQTSIAKTYLNKALSKLERFEALNAGFIDTKSEKAEINSILKRVK